MRDENSTKNEGVPSHFHVCIFGSARIRKGDPEYDLVYQLSTMIAESGMDIVTGGGPGLMEAASKGHKDGRKDENSHTIGLTIHLPKEQKMNPLFLCK